MSTNCRIGITSKFPPYNNIVKSIYCHCDGYPENKMPILKHHYNTRDAVEALINLGDISALHENLNPPCENYDFNNNPDKVTIAYHRDRGEQYEDVKPIESNATALKNMESYVYIFNIDTGTWTGFYNKHKITKEYN